MSTRNKFLATRVVPEIYEEIKQHARKRGLSVSDVLRELIYEKFHREEKEEKE